MRLVSLTATYDRFEGRISFVQRTDHIYAGSLNPELTLSLNLETHHIGRDLAKYNKIHNKKLSA